jgi:hypothetical protein
MLDSCNMPIRYIWKGDTVVSLNADPAIAKIGYSGLMEQNVRLFYGPDNPAPIYRRGDYIKEKYRN